MASTSREKKRIRVSVKPKSCPNPLFEKWLQELKDDAVRNDSRLQYVYGKALKSLRKYPLVLESAKQCKVLEHFGDGLCKILDKKLAQHLASGGSLGNSSGNESYDGEESPPTKVRRGTSVESSSRRSKVKEYIPARRSGAYGLLMGLLKHTGSDGYLKKKELQDLAQPYADVSFAQTDTLNGQYYNAWSSMGTLISKELVEKQGNPARFQLTDAGRRLAERLDQAEAELNNSSQTGKGESVLPPRLPHIKNVDTATTPTKKVAKTVAKRIEKIDSHGIVKPPTPLKPTGNFQPNEVISIDDDEFDLYPVQESWSLNFKETTTSLSTNKIPTGSVKSYTSKDTEAESNLQSALRFSETGTSHEPLSRVNPATTTQQPPLKRVTKPASLRGEKMHAVEKAKVPSSFELLQTNEIISLDDEEFDDHPEQNPLFHSSEQIFVPKTAEVHKAQVVEESSVTQVRDQVILKPNEYEIVLCVDCAEVSGSSGSGHNQKESAAKLFQNCGIPYDVRKLSVGDYLWICKPKNPMGKGTDRELALPYVVERKRLDDLVSSIKDGRFKEQKFRLKHSGLVRPIYLIEEHGNRQNLGLPELSVLQAVANTLIIEKFQIHWTQKSDESVRFLVEMTKQLSQIYQGKTVTSRSCQEKVGIDWQTRLITFKELYVNSTKSKPLSVTQMFAKQLMQLNGLSGDKAEAIVKRYPTPYLLIEALQAAGSSASTLLASIEYGKSKRKIGSLISGHLAKLYGQEQLEM